MNVYISTLEGKKTEEDLRRDRIDRHAFSNRISHTDKRPAQIVFVSKTAETTINGQSVADFLQADFVRRHGSDRIDTLHGPKTFQDIQADENIRDCTARLRDPSVVPRHALTIRQGDELVVDGQSIDTSASAIFSGYTRTITL